MKKSLLVISAIVLAITVNAQSGKRTTLSIGLDAGIPVGLVSSNVFSFVIGGSLQAGFPVSKNFDITLSGGYDSWLAKGGGGSIGYVPLLAGFTYGFSPKVYGSGQLGVSPSTTKGSGNPFTFAPGLGFRISRNVDLLFKYTGMTFKGGGSFNDVGIRFAYNFGK